MLCIYIYIYIYIHTYIPNRWADSASRVCLAATSVCLGMLPAHYILREADEQHCLSNTYIMFYNYIPPYTTN